MTQDEWNSLRTGDIIRHDLFATSNSWSLIKIEYPFKRVAGSSSIHVIGKIIKTTRADLGHTLIWTDLIPSLNLGGYILISRAFKKQPRILLINTDD